MTDSVTTRPALLRQPIRLSRCWIALLWTAIAAAPGMYMALTSSSWSVESYETNCSDALIFRVSAELLEKGRSPYDLTRQRKHIAATRLDGQPPIYDLPFAYPPNALPILAVYQAGTPRTGFLLFVALGMTAMLASCYLLSHRFCHRQSDRVLTLLACGLGGATLFNCLLGQTGTLLAAAVFVFVFAYGRHGASAGLALGLMAFKPQYALPLGLVALIDRQWKALAWSVMTLVTMSLISGMLWGFGAWPEFLRAAGAFNHTVSHMCNWLALIPVGWSVSIGSTGVAVMLTGCLAVTLFCRQYAGGRFALMRLGFAIAIALVASPNTHPYDLIIWLVPIGALAYGARSWPAWVPVLAAGCITAWAIAGQARWILPLISTGLALNLIVAVRRVDPRTENTITFHQLHEAGQSR